MPAGFPTNSCSQPTYSKNGSCPLSTCYTFMLDLIYRINYQHMKPTFKNTIPIWAAALLVAAIFISCRTERDIPCDAIPEPQTLQFPNDTLLDIRWLPFEPGKIWVQTNRRIFELDIQTRQEKPLNGLFQNFFYQNPEYYTTDPYDSLMWVGGPNRNVVFYDSKTKNVEELPVNYVHRIIAEPDKVYLIAFHQVCYWDRKSRSLHQVPNNPLQYIQTCEVVDDTTLILERQYTFFLRSQRFVKGFFAGKYEFEGYRRINDANALLYKENAFYRVWKGEAEPLPLQMQGNLYNIAAAAGKYWQWNNQFFFVYDPKTGKSDTIPYRLTPINNYSPAQMFDARHIWVQRPDQLLLIDLASHQQLNYPVLPEEKYLHTVLSNCNVYAVFQNQIRISFKDDFVAGCTPFDVKMYDAQLEQLNHTADSLGLGKDTTIEVALQKLNTIKAWFGGLDHVEVQQKLTLMDWLAFQKVDIALPDGYVRCYRDETLPVSYRKGCLKRLVDEYGRMSKFKKVIEFEQEYHKYFGKPDQVADYYFLRHVESVRAYLTQVDSLEKSALAADSLYYFKALAQEIICRNWYCSEGCGGCDFSLVINALNPFAQKFPESDLVDNAEFYLFPFNYMYDEEEETIKEINRNYRAFIRKYPESDLLADAWYWIFQNCQILSTPDEKGMKEAGKKFLQDYGDDKRAAEIREELKARGLY